MSEKHEPPDGPDARHDAESVSDDPSPFKLSSLDAGGESVSGGEEDPPPTVESSIESSIEPPLEPSATDLEAPASTPPDLLDGGAIISSEPPDEPGAEIDAGVQELQARPADVAAPPHSEPPRTIVSDRVPEWPTGSDGGLPPLVIDGETPTQRRAGPDEAAIPAPEPPAAEPPAAEPPASEPSAPEPDASAQPLAAEAEEAAAPNDDEAPADIAPADIAPDITLGDMAPPVAAPPAEPPADVPETMSKEVTDFGALDVGVAARAEKTGFSVTPIEVGAGRAQVPASIEPELAVSESELVETGKAVPVEPVMTTDAEPTPMELAAIPVEADDAVPVAAIAGSAAATGFAAARARDHGASHGQTAAEFFAHAHEDLEHRRGVMSLGLLTRLSGLGGLLAGAAALAILLLSCAGYGALTEQNIASGQHILLQSVLYVGGLAVVLAVGAVFWKSWWPSAVLATVVAIAAGGGWFALTRYHDRVQGFDLLSLSPWITYIGLGGLALAILGGLIEHRRMREETHVLAAVFTNILASAAGGVLWMLWLGMSLFGK